MRPSTKLVDRIRILCLALACLLFAAFGQSGRPDFSAIDRGVRALPKAASLDEVVRQLTPFGTDPWTKTRAIWIWLTENIAYDTESFFSGSYRSTKAEDVFARRSSVCAGYGRLFAYFGQRLGLEVIEVTGGSKGYGYTTGGSLGGHAWNAVNIHGVWHLFDSTWGAGPVGYDRKFLRKYNEYWFDTPAAEFAFYHFPKNPEFWLLPEPLSEVRFRALPDLQGAFQDWRNMGFTLPKTVSELAALKGPKTYSTHAHTLRVVDIPFTDRLARGVPARFTFTAAGISKAAVINAGKWTMLEPKDGVFQTSVNPLPGELKVSLYYNHNGQTSYWTAVQYTVD